METAIPMQQMISLDFIKSNPFIRVKPGTPPLISVIDVIMAVTGKDNDSAGKTFHRIRNLKMEVGCTAIKTIQFLGQGQRPTPVADIECIKNILNLLPQKRSAIARKTGYIYLVHPAIARDNVYKVGMTICVPTDKYPVRVQSYGSKPADTYLRNVDARMARVIESAIIKKFNKHFILAQGKEFFEGDSNHMRKIIDKIVDEFEDGAKLQRCLAPR